MTAVFPPTKAAGEARLSDFVARAGKAYAAGRNFDHGVGAHTAVSILSPYTRTRLVLEEDIISAVLVRHSFSAAEKFVQEVFWRGYFKGWMEQRPSVWHAYQRDLAALKQDMDLQQRYEDAVGGRTGIDCFDAWAQELTATGYLHNHARMWFASIWIFTLGLPWQLGADFFLHHLLDGDPASNTLSWRWVAGLHTKGKNYLARADNIYRYTDGRFNPFGELNETAAPLTEAADHPRVTLTELGPAPMGMRFGLLLTEEDCQPETLPLIEGPAALFALPPLADGSDQVVTFRRAAVADAAERAAAQFGLDCAQAGEVDGVAAIVEWARAAGLKAVTTAYAPLGPTADLLDALERALNGHDIALVRIRRRYDSLVWPHATAGFFKLKTKIPKILAALEA